MRDLLLDAITEAAKTFEGMVRTEGFATDLIEACMTANPFDGPVTVDNVKKFSWHALDAYTRLLQYKVSLSLVTGCITATVKQSSGPNVGGLMGACQKSLSWWSLSNSYQDVAFGSLPIVRLYRAINKRVCPAFLLGGCKGLFGENNSDGSEYEERVVLEGIIRSVIYRNAIPTITQLVVDHAEFVYHYIRRPHLYRRTMRSHAITTSVEVVEIVVGTAVRCLGAAAAYKVLPVQSRVCGAFVAENVLLLLSSLIIVRRVVTPVAGRVELQMNKWLPPTEIELLEDEKDEEEELNEHRKATEESLSGWHEGDESPYTVLDVPVNATKEVIKKKYKQLALQMHPDKVAHLPVSQKEAMEIRFKKVASAYEILSDDEKRNNYAKESGERHSGDMLKRLEKLSVYAQLPILLSIMGLLICLMWGLGFAKFHNAFRSFTKGGVSALRLWY